MQDRVPLYPGRVMLTPVPGQENTFDMVRADSPTQEGTPLNKANMLKDATAAMFGLGDTAVPDDVLSFLGKYAQNIWKRRTYEAHYNATLSSGVNQYCLGGGSSTTVSNTIYYSDEIELDSSGATVLKNEQSIDVSYSNRNDPIVQSLPGKYIRNAKQSLPSNESRPNEVLYVDPSATISGATGDGNTRYGVYISSKGAKIATAYLSPIVGEWEYIYSTNRNAYPDIGESEGYEYQYLGIPFDNAVTAPIFEYGSYIGTGTGGSSAPNSLTFDFTTRLVIICGDTEYSSGFADYSCKIIAVRGITSTDSIGEDGTSTYVAIEWTDKGLSWYSRSSSSSASILAKYQLNTSGKTYYYVAIG